MRRRLTIPAVLAVVLLVVGQLVAYAHHANERHVTCAEHGDELDAVELAGALDTCDHDHWIGVDGDDGGGHDECPIQKVLRQSSAAPGTWVLPPPTAILTQAPSPVLDVSARTPVALYRIAPKTSPPA